MPGRLVKRATYVSEYHELTKKDGAAVCSLRHLEGYVLCGFHSLGRRGMRAILRSVRANRSGRIPRLSRRRRSPITFSCGSMLCSHCFRHLWRLQRYLIGPVLVIIGLLLLPFLSGEGEKSWERRPIAVLTVLLIAITLGTFTHLAGFTPWSPHMNAWSGDPVPERFLSWCNCTSAARSAGLSGQTMPQLPFAR